jgi:hypothetical protein
MDGLEILAEVIGEVFSGVGTIVLKILLIDGFFRIIGAVIAITMWIIVFRRILDVKNFLWEHCAKQLVNPGTVAQKMTYKGNFALFTVINRFFIAIVGFAIIFYDAFVIVVTLLSSKLFILTAALVIDFWLSFIFIPSITGSINMLSQVVGGTVGLIASYYIDDIMGIKREPNWFQRKFGKKNQPAL